VYEPLSLQGVTIDLFKPDPTELMLTYEDLRAVSPALEHYTKGQLLRASGSDRSFRRVAAAL
jgi:hypothetical protein